MLRRVAAPRRGLNAPPPPGPPPTASAPPIHNLTKRLHPRRAAVTFDLSKPGKPENAVRKIGIRRFVRFRRRANLVSAGPSVRASRRPPPGGRASIPSSCRASARLRTNRDGEWNGGVLADLRRCRVEPLRGSASCGFGRENGAVGSKIRPVRPPARVSHSRLRPVRGFVGPRPSRGGLRMSGARGGCGLRRPQPLGGRTPRVASADRSVSR